MASASLFQTSVLSRSASRAVLSPVCSTAASVRCARSSASVAPGGWTARSVPACTPCVSGRCNRVVAQASEQGNTGSSRDPSLDGFVEVKVNMLESTPMSLSLDRAPSPRPRPAEQLTSFGWRCAGRPGPRQQWKCESLLRDAFWPRIHALVSGCEYHAWHAVAEFYRGARCCNTAGCGVPAHPGRARARASGSHR